MAHLLYRATSSPTVPGSTTVKGSGLTNAEIDGNWKSLNDGKLEVSSAVSANTPSTVVLRDASGNFSAGTITAALSGNATTATTLQNSRTINGVSFNGSANITITANTTNTLTFGSYLTGTSFNGSSAVTIAVNATNLNTASTVVARDSSGNFSAGTITAALSGNATTATSLATAVTINGVSFNGSTNINVPTQNTLTRGSYLTGNNFNGSAATTWAVDAATAATPSTVVARNASGDFSANIITVLDLNSTSDRNLKTNIQPVQDALGIVEQLSGVSFDWKDGGKSSFGLIAQELQDVLPNLVSTSQSGHLVVNYIPIIAILIEAIKQQNQTIQQLLNK